MTRLCCRKMKKSHLKFLKCLTFEIEIINPRKSIGSNSPPENSLMNSPISPRRRHVSAGLHATDTLWHACNFFTYSSRERYDQAREVISGPFISSSFEMAMGVRGLNRFEVYN